VTTEEKAVVRYPQGLPHVQVPCHRCVVLVVDPPHNRHAGRLRTAPHLDALTIDRDDKARFPSELLCRAAQQCAGLPDGHARSHAKRTLHFQASLSTGTVATLEARQQHGEAASGVSMARLTRRAFKQQLLERIAPYGAQGHRLEKSSPDDEELGHDGTLTETAA
jgi:hypothetical protein